MDRILEMKFDGLVSVIETMIQVPQMPLRVKQYLGAAETEIEMARNAYEDATS